MFRLLLRPYDLRLATDDRLARREKDERTRRKPGRDKALLPPSLVREDPGPVASETLPVLASEMLLVSLSLRSHLDAETDAFRFAASDSSAGPQRRRLELSARSTTSTDSSPASSPAPSRPSPFGAARPVDFTEKDRAAEAKLAAEQAATAARVAAEKERKASEPTREDKLAAARAAVVAPKVEVEKVAEPTVASPPASAAVLTSLRKDGFSYSTIANAKDEELMKQLGETTI